jgi:urate oxidase
MSELAHNSYGKSHIRLTKVTRLPDRHEMKELLVNIQLMGDFADTYLTGDNSKIIATDSMKNTVYVLAKKHPIDSIENFADALVWHFVNTYPQVAHAMVEIEQTRWHRIERDGRPHPHAFVAGGDERRTCSVGNNAGELVHHAGIKDLVVLKTTDSAFKGYVRDQFTTLPETNDRIFATSIRAQWFYADALKPGDWNDKFDRVRSTLLDTFAGHRSLSVQQTLYAMGQAVLARCPQIDLINIEMPNQHRIPFNFAAFGLSNDNEIFVPTDEPFGMISGTISRRG